MQDKIVLTGVKPTHKPHLGNYLGAIRPALELAENYKTSLLFIADYHALTAVHDAEHLKNSTYDVAASWIACGLNPEKTIIYRQSDIPEIFELSWVLSCFTAKGLMNRAHAYKAKMTENEQAGKSDLDFGVNMGLFTYPILMSADILLFNTDIVPVGEDQVQHVEYARDIAQKINHIYKSDVLKVPEYYLKPGGKLVPGLDGRKMSKSYNNHIPLFLEEKKLRKLIMKIKTDSSAPEDSKDPNNSLIFDLYKSFASETEIIDLAEQYKKGISWGDAKQILFESIRNHFKEANEIYTDLMSNPEGLNNILSSGAEKARELARPVMSQVRKTIGIHKY